MKSIIRAVSVLFLVGLAALTGYAYLGDLEPAAVEISQPVELNVDK